MPLREQTVILQDPRKPNNETSLSGKVTTLTQGQFENGVTVLTAINHDLSDVSCIDEKQRTGSMLAKRMEGDLVNVQANRRRLLQT